jgi:hypothetical protein
MRGKRTKESEELPALQAFEGDESISPPLDIQVRERRIRERGHDVSARGPDPIKRNVGDAVHTEVEARRSVPLHPSDRIKEERGELRVGGMDKAATGLLEDLLVHLRELVSILVREL